MNETDVKLLDKGLTFIPTCNSMPLFKFYNSQNRLIRNLKLRDYFSNKTGNNNNNKWNREFTLPSNWSPPDHHVSQDTLDSIQNIVTSTETLFSASKIDKGFNKIFYYHKNNLSNSEKTALNNIRNNNSIIIKPADKGGATVVMNHSSYLAEAYRQLNDAKYYTKLNAPIYRNNIPRINAVLNNMLNDRIVTAKQVKYLQAKDTDRERLFYLLPKIHKPREKWPQPNMPEGRPIVSDCNSESYRVSKFIDSYIRPISMNHFAFIKDTYDFISKIRNHKIPANAILVTGDVSALYTNMNINRTIGTVNRALGNANFDNKLKNYLLNLLEITLKNNDFQFNNEYFLQICGTAMGKAYAPALADLYMQEIDSRACHGTFKDLIQLYFRFLDDIFFIWLGSMTQLKEFEIFINSIIPGIKITFNTSEREIHFLDTTVYKFKINDDTLLYTKIYFKETDTHQLLHKNSFHPKHTFTGILKSQLLRFKRISSTFNDYDNACKTLFSVLCSRGYSKSLLRKMKRDIWALDATLKRKNHNEQDNSVPIVVPFCSTGTLLSRQWRSIIKQNSKFNNSRLITAYCNSNNLYNKLVTSSLHNSADKNVRLNDNNIITSNSGMHKCCNNKCKACNYINAGKNIQSSHNKRIFNIRHNLTCKSSNIIYLITCKRCNKQYVGQTGRALAERLNDHLSNIRTKKLTPIALHFNLPNHRITDFNISAIEQINNSDDSLNRRLVKESTWQNLLQTAYPLGINNLKPAYLI